MKSKLLTIISSLVLLVVMTVLPTASFALSWSQVNQNDFGGTPPFGNSYINEVVNFKGRMYAAKTESDAGYDSTWANLYRCCGAGQSGWNNVFDGDTKWDADFDLFPGDDHDSDQELIPVVINNRLYVGTKNVSGGELWVSDDGDNYSLIYNDGIDNQDNTAIRSIIQFNGNIYLGTANDNDGARIYRIENNSSATQVNDDGFGDFNNTEVTQMFVFDGYLYAGIYNPNGSQLYRSASGDIGSWTLVNNDGFSDSNNTYIIASTIFNNEMYIGTYNTTDGGQVLVSSNGTSWATTGGDGLGSSHNTEIGSLLVANDGNLYAGTRNDTDGAKLYYSSNGTSWSQDNGINFSNPYNYAIFAMYSDSNTFFAVMSNKHTGAEVFCSGCTNGNWCILDAIDDPSTTSNSNPQSPISENKPKVLFPQTGVGE